MRISRRPACVVMALALACLPACGRFARRGSADVVQTIVPTTYRADRSLPPIAKVDDFRKGRKGILHVLLLDNLNRPLPGAYIRYKGPESGEKATDAKGIMEVLVTPGAYKVDVAPCGTTVVTNDYQDAIASVVAGGQPSQGTLAGIRWQRRFHPVASVKYTTDPPWRVDEDVRASIRVEDRCPDSYGAAARASLPTFWWRTTSNFRIDARPIMRADRDGYLHLSFHCDARGNGAVTIYDAGKAEDPINILEAGAGPGSGHKFCE